MGDLTIIILSVGIVIICWVMIKINDKVDRHISRFKKLENALLKNSTNHVRTNAKLPAVHSNDIPSAQTSRDNHPKAMNFIAKK
jgi:hypothetical protein